MRLSIHVLPFSRLYFLLNTIKEISKINNEYKNSFQVVMHSQNGLNLEMHKNILKSNNINFIVLNENGCGDYLPKIKNAINVESDYSMKIDEDIFITHYVLQFIMDNLSYLDKENILALTPVLSTGIPSVEMFIEDVLDNTEKQEMYDIFNNTNIPNLWGASYEILNKRKEKWDSDYYYGEVSKINHFYKGIHPIRVNENAQIKMMNFIQNKKDKITEKQDYYIQNKKVPYFCNSVFIIKTKIWRDIINNSSLYRDPFDEVPINLYKDKYNLDLAFIRNSNSIHPSYNTVGNFLNIATSFSNILSRWV